MEWNEQDEAEWDGNRGSKSRQYEYAVHKYESGLLNFMKDTCRIVAHGPGWCDWNRDKCFFMFLAIE
jgi:hypothetical protein